jgi:hypothetical protein
LQIRLVIEAGQTPCLLINSALKYRSIVMMFLTQLLLGLVDVVEEKAEDFFAFFADDLCTLMIFLLK